MFRILGCIDALNEHLQLGLTWHDVVYMYEFHSQADEGYYLKSRSAVVRLISCLPKSNEGMKDDYLIVSRPWHDGLHCPVKRESQVGYIRVIFPRKILQTLSSSLHNYDPLPYITSII